MEDFRHTDDDGDSLTIELDSCPCVRMHPSECQLDAAAIERLRDALTEWLDSQPKEVTVRLGNVADGEKFKAFGRSFRRDDASDVLTFRVRAEALDDYTEYSQLLHCDVMVTVVR
jgi:hypothetical protein